MCIPNYQSPKMNLAKNEHKDNNKLKLIICQYCFHSFLQLLTLMLIYANMYPNMTQPLQAPQIVRNASEIKTGEKEQTLSNRVISLVNHVARSPEYGELASKKVPHTEAFSSAIDSIVNSPDNGFNSFDNALLVVTSKLGTFIEAQQELDEIESERKSNGGHLTESSFQLSKKLKKEYVIPFNHELKALINEGPNVKMRDLTTALTSAHTAVFSRYNSLYPNAPKNPRMMQKPSEVAYNLDTIVNGMRHEIAAETMLSAANIEYDYNVTVDEDARGIDIIVYLDGKREPVDIKSSLAAENRTRDKHPDARAVWTELGWEDFTGMKGNNPGALSIPYSTAEYSADSFVDRIRTIIGYSNTYKQTNR